MSPENKLPASPSKVEMITHVPGFSRVETGHVSVELSNKEPVDFAELSARILSELGDQASTVDTVTAMAGFIDAIKAAADRGEFVPTSEPGEAKKLPYTKGQIADTLKSMAAVLNGHSKSPDDLKIRLPRAGGLRTAFAAMIDDGRTAKTFLDVIEGTISPEKLEKLTDQKADRDLGAEALDMVGASRPEGLAVEESKKEMLDRHVSEYQADLSELYAEHRNVDPRSDRARELEYQIKLTKDDIGRVDRQRRNL